MKAKEVQKKGVGGGQFRSLWGSLFCGMKHMMRKSEITDFNADYSI